MTPAEIDYLVKKVLGIIRAPVPGLRPGAYGPLTVKADGTIAAAAYNGCHAYHTSNQAIPDDGALHALDFGANWYDTSVYHTPGMDATLFTLPQTGIYDIFVWCEFAQNDDGARDLFVVLTSEGFDISIGHDSKEAVIGSGEETSLMVRTRWYCLAGDTLTAQVQQTSGGDLNILAAETGYANRCMVAIEFLGNLLAAPTPP